MMNQIEEVPRESRPSPAARRKRNRIPKKVELLEANNRSLRKLSAQLLQLQDQERSMVARHLNDATGQELAALSLKLTVMFRKFGNLDLELANGFLENIRLAKHMANELQTISYLLHPPLLDEMGLPMALRCYLDGFGKRSNIQVHFELSDNLGRLPRNLEITIFRVAQECLTNIHRRAQRPTASIRLYESASRIMLEVRDHGKGIADEKLSRWTTCGVGLGSIQERVREFNEEFEIAMLPGGIEIRVSIPLPGTEADS